MWEPGFKYSSRRDWIELIRQKYYIEYMMEVEGLSWKNLTYKNKNENKST